MATYILLATFTDQGIRGIKDTTKRSDAIKAMAAKFGVKPKSIYWTLGSYDVVAIYEAPDDASFMAFGMALGAAGNVRTQTLHAFNQSEIGAILGKLP